MIEHNGMITLCLVIFSYICQSQTFYNLIFLLIMTITIIVLIVTIAMFIWGRVRGDIVALSALMVLTATGILTTNEALSGFSSPIVIMMV